MPHITTDDGVRLYYEEAGSGDPVIFVHEFAGDYRSWEPQMRFLSRRYRCITYNARGYPPSDVPDAVAAYSQDRARLDIVALMDGLNIDKAHICGLSMGGFATLHFGIHHADRALSLVVAGCGYGAEKDQSDKFRQEVDATAKFIEESDGKNFADRYALGPTRVQFENKDPRGWAEFHQQLSEHSLTGSALTMRGVQRERPSLFDLEDDLRNIRTPMLVVTGDEDEPCLLPNIYLKRVVSSAALVVMPNAGHTINIEDPDMFNRIIDEFMTQVNSGRWPMRDPRSLDGSIIGSGEDSSS